MQRSSQHIRRLCVMALLCAMAYISVALVRIPVVSFLKYEPKDVLLVIGGYLYGPITGGAMAVIVSLIELVTVSDTGPIGCAMNILSSCLFVCTASALYYRRRTLRAAILGLVLGSLATTAGMLLWNYLITPLYMELPRQAIAEMLLPVFLPFNLFKTVLNSTLTVMLYKSVTKALRASRLLPPAEAATTKQRSFAWLIALFLLLSLAVLWLVWQGII